MFGEMDKRAEAQPERDPLGPYQKQWDLVRRFDWLLAAELVAKWEELLTEYDLEKCENNAPKRSRFTWIVPRRT